MTEVVIVALLAAAAGLLLGWLLARWLAGRLLAAAWLSNWPAGWLLTG